MAYDRTMDLALRHPLSTTMKTVSTPVLSSVLTLWKDIEAMAPARPDGCECAAMCFCGDAFSFLTEHTRREEFRAKFSYAVPTRPAMRRLAKFIAGDTVLEVGAGRALWARLLLSYNVNVIPTDACTPLTSGYPPLKTSDDTFMPVRALTAIEAVSTIDANVLMLVWPPYDTVMASDALSRFTGEKVVYIGEGSGGCTADKAFHEQLESDWSSAGSVTIPQWPGIHDCVRLYTRKD